MNTSLKSMQKTWTTANRDPHSTQIQESERLEEKAEKLAQEIAALQQETLITTPEQLENQIKKIQKSPLPALKRKQKSLLWPQRK